MQSVMSMRRLKQHAPTFVLVAGVLVTIATSAPIDDIRMSEDTRQIDAGETLHVVLRANQAVVKNANAVTLTLWYESFDGTSPEMRIIPDDPEQPIATAIDTWSSSPELMLQCPSDGDCEIGFSVELTDETQIVRLHAIAEARESDTPACIVPANPSFPSNATVEVAFDDL